MIIAGPSGSGKTSFVIQLLKNMKQDVNWYNTEESAIPQYIKDRANTKVFTDLPDSFDMVENGKILVLDDLMIEAYNKNVCELFTKGSHHRNISVILLIQNVYHQGKFCRDISLNCKYLVLFKNPRDMSQILVLGRQIFPESPKEFEKVYKDATAVPYGYLFLDLTQECNDLYRFRVDIFNKEFITTYVPKAIIAKLEKNETFEGASSYVTRIKRL